MTEFALVVTAIANLLAAGFIWYTAIETRKHNRLSIRPMLQFSAFAVLESDDVEIVLSNLGPGTACITSIDYTIDGTTIVPETATQIDRLGSLLPSHASIISSTGIRAGAALMPGAKFVLLQVGLTTPGSPGSALNRDQVFRALSGITFRVSYTSTSGEQRPEVRWEIRHERELTAPGAAASTPPGN